VPLAPLGKQRHTEEKDWGDPKDLKERVKITSFTGQVERTYLKRKLRGGTKKKRTFTRGVLRLLVGSKGKKSTSQLKEKKG